ncbi:MAG: hypothetical protein GY795_28390 [Desulfobacterales bacterium]|nr:hypothetical protein [Desulfobacterales bacterium]
MKKFIIGFTVLCMFIMVAGISNAQNVITSGCVENDSGSIDIAGTSAVCSGNLSVPVRIQNAPDAFDSVGFEIAYDSAMLTYTGFEKEGTLAENFDQFDVSEISAGILRCGGFRSSSEISAGTDTDLIYLKFAVSSDCNESKLEIRELKDDIKSWSASSGCFRPADKCTGDINGDGETTPGDALCAFEKYMGVCPTSCGLDCADVCCDVNSDNDCTPADALCIFNKYLGNPGCIDDNPVSPANIELTANPASIPADGQTKTIISARVLQDDGTSIPDDTEVNFRIMENSDEDVGKFGTGLNVSVYTIEGVAHAILTSGRTPRTVTIQVSSGELTSEIQVEYTPLAAFITIAKGTSIRSVNNDTAYEVPMSVTVTGANGNPVPNAEVSLSTWPYQFALGQWVECDPGSLSCCINIRDRFYNEDVNRNQVLDEGEDKNEDGMLMPPKSAAGIVQPSLVVTDQNGTADFSLVYPKSMAGWIEAEITATTVSHDNTVETDPLNVRTSVNLWMGWTEEDRCSLPDSPFNDSPVSTNTPPEISSVPNQMVHEDTMIEATVTVSDKEGGALNISVTSGNNELIPNDSSHISIKGYGQSYVLLPFPNESVNLPIIITPAANMHGTTELTLTVVDDADNTATRVFLLNVLPVNDLPVISAISNKTTQKDTPLDISFMLSDVEGGDITVSASSNNSYLVPNDNNHIDINGFGMEHTFTLTPGENSLPLKITPAAHQSGTATITIKAEDGDFSVTSTFVLAVQD